MKFYILSSLALSSCVLGACASTPGARPSDMSVAQHEQAAGAAEAQAAGHDERYNPSQKANVTNCDPYGGCWTSNSTQQHLDDADKYRKMAADHRAASQSLRGAEARACIGISESDRDVSPFSHRQDILSVEPAGRSTPRYDERGNPSLMTGAVVTFRAVPGMTVEWLQRVVDCHVARNSATGDDMPEMNACPLAVKGATATVSSGRGGFAVTIEASDGPAIKEILRRAQALRNPG